MIQNRQLAKITYYSARRNSYEMGFSLFLSLHVEVGMTLVSYEVILESYGDYLIDINQAVFFQVSNAEPIKNMTKQFTDWLEKAVNAKLV